VCAFRLQTFPNARNSHLSINQSGGGILSYDRGDFCKGIFCPKRLCPGDYIPWDIIPGHNRGLRPFPLTHMLHSATSHCACTESSGVFIGCLVVYEIWTFTLCLCMACESIVENVYSRRKVHLLFENHLLTLYVRR